METRGGEGQPEFLSFGALPRILSLSGPRRKVSRLQGGVDVQEPEPLGLSQLAPLLYHVWVFKSNAAATSQVSPPNLEGAMVPTGFSN